MGGASVNCFQLPTKKESMENDAKMINEAYLHASSPTWKGNFDMNSKLQR
jgi:hypothetical protein